MLHRLQAGGIFLLAQAVKLVFQQLAELEVKLGTGGRRSRLFERLHRDDGRLDLSGVDLGEQGRFHEPGVRDAGLRGLRLA